LGEGAYEFERKRKCYERLHEKEEEMTGLSSKLDEFTSRRSHLKITVFLKRK
jgi:hypothetical protein